MIPSHELNREFIKDQYKPISPFLGDLRDTCRKEDIPLIRKDTEMILRFLAGLIKPENILEIGTAIGYSAILLAEACKEASIYTVEKDEAAFKRAEHNIISAGLDGRIHVLFGDGEEKIEELEESGFEKRFDLIFIDASKSHYKRFLQAALDLAEDRALIISDDIFQHGYTVSPDRDPKAKHATNRKRMLEYLDYITGTDYLETTLLETGDGLALSLFNRTIYERYKYK
jgi:predicted O-methyltransferase YrrM